MRDDAPLTVIHNKRNRGVTLTSAAFVMECCNAKDGSVPGARGHVDGWGGMPDMDPGATSCDVCGDWGSFELGSPVGSEFGAAADARRAFCSLIAPPGLVSRTSA